MQSAECRVQNAECRVKEFLVGDDLPDIPKANAFSRLNSIGKGDLWSPVFLARLHGIDLEANEILDTIIPRLATERGIDENLKARDMLRWVAEMNNIKANAEEIVLREVVLI